MRIRTKQTPEELYGDIILQLKEQGVICAITGGLACVHFGVAHFTEDCDLICAPINAEQLLRVLCQNPYKGVKCAYRSLSAPLDAKWLAGGYTSHFYWPGSEGDKPYLDVFGVPPRVTSAWNEQMQGSYASPHIVAEMKRTKRRRDWDQASALGLKLVQEGDDRGWLHIFDAELLKTLIAHFKPGRETVKQRPVLQLAIEDSPLLGRAIQTEVDFWSQLDHIRLAIYQQAAKPYARVIHKALETGSHTLMTQHNILLAKAETLLPRFPLRDYGIENIIREAREATSVGLDARFLDYLPDVSAHIAPTFD